MDGEIIFAIVSAIMVIIGFVAIFIIGGCVENDKLETISSNKDESLENFQPEFNINLENSVVKLETVYVD